MTGTTQSTLLRSAAAVLGVLGLGLLLAGGWLVVLGGSWYYAIAGLGFLWTAVLLLRAHPAALWLYAAIVLASLLWALCESGLDWWPLAARGDVVFLIGLLLLLPPIARRLHHSQSESRLLRSPRMPLGAALAVAFLVAAYSWTIDLHERTGSVADAAAASATAQPQIPEGEWHAYGRTGYGQRYSPLAQITPENVESLEVAWQFRTGDVPGQPGDPVETTFQVTPLKIGESLFLCTPHQQVIALDATTGDEIWRYNPQIRDNLALQHLTCRGLSYHPGGAEAVAPDSAPRKSDVDLPVAATDGDADSCDAMLFMPTADGRLIALNPENGQVCGNFGNGTGQIDLWANMPNVKPGGYYSTSPVVVTADRIIIGGTVLDNVRVNEPSGVIRAFDLQSGALLWNWDPARPEATAPIPEGETYTASSPNSWSISSVDEALGLVYVPMGNQPPDQYGANRTEEVERYSSSVVALELETGQVRWVFQTVHHDLWDYDVPSQPSLIDLTMAGETVPALVQPTKQGDIFVLDRRTGAPILPVREETAPKGAVEPDWTAPTQPVSALSYRPDRISGKDMWGATIFDQLACRIAFHRLRYDGMFTPPSLEGSLVHPGNFGVFNWGSIAVDPTRQIAFVTPTYLPFVSRLVPRADETTLYVQDKAPEGSLPALNENFGAPYAVQLAPFTSALGLPCIQPPWGYVAAADLTTGKTIWQHKNGTVRDSSPIPLPFRMGVPNLGGPIITAGGVAFLSSALDYYIRAYDLQTGEERWRGRLPAGGQATPMTYTGQDGRQYLLVIAGGHGSLGTKTGDHVIAYALPRTRN
ncbi:MAG: membrane-bound PQQ-dependent dehydrogenase, glucose/quinate/shikimate family [Alphaproteobacteria bacterium]|nr:membrane-bound PQQ-dependent dehydrogenase, glucose/quinate/shikimate family [Alphaproteobacteria bacterium]MBU0799216.1 membrane-bound PQQ-dependent dehydrogenase, glucose/quinate/shikimate family [Alphaproteobacteria bacterium]MBU0887533.1 membrane-bound PQQ-dependent dehydrogenase, glucose/quinate/shikimate family [Alphaproteobacteria bacterium]MBU1814770.1 membrane-bound PQQ-dependent dehydrogenase, glucose/quinate/shikimate family [Alphaproteobacteria bacterium]